MRRVRTALQRHEASLESSAVGHACRVCEIHRQPERQFVVRCPFNTMSLMRRASFRAHDPRVAVEPPLAARPQTQIGLDRTKSLQVMIGRVTRSVRCGGWDAGDLNECFKVKDRAIVASGPLARLRAMTVRHVAQSAGQDMSLQMHEHVVVEDARIKPDSTSRCARRTNRFRHRVFAGW